MEDTDVLSIINGVTGQNQTATAALPAAVSLAAQSGISPDTEAEWQRMSKASGVPVNLIRNGAPVKLMQLQQQAAELPATAPATAAHLANPDNAAVAYDDAGNLSGIEQAIQNWVVNPIKGFMPRLAQKVGGLQQMIGEYRATAPSFYENEQENGQALAEQGRALVTGSQDDLRATAPKDFGGELIQGIVDMAPAVVLAPLTGGGSIMMDMALGGAGSKYAAERLRGASPEDATTSATASGALYAATSLLPVHFLLKPGMSLLKRTVATTLANTLGMDAAEAGSLLVDKATVSPNMTLQDAINDIGRTTAMGLAQGAVMPMMTHPYEHALQTYRDNAYHESTGLWPQADFGQMSVEDLYNGMEKKPNISSKDLEQLQKDNPYTETKLPTAMYSLVMQMPGGSREDAEISRVKQTASFLLDAGEQVQNSKLNQRLPEKMPDLVRKMMDEHGAQSDVYVPVEKWNELFQSAGIDPAEAAETTLSDPSRYYEALHTGSDIAIPVEEYVTKLSGLDQYKDLVQNTRESLGGMTPAESADFETTKEQRLKEYLDQADAAHAADAPARQVFADAYQQLKEVHGADAAKKQAEIIAANARTQAAGRNEERIRNGLEPTHDAWSYYQEHPLKMERITGAKAAGIDLQGQRELHQEKISDAGAQMGELHDLAVGESSTNKKIDIAPVPEWKVSAVAPSVDIAGYRHQADMYSVKHILAQHGNAKREEARGQLVMRPEDIKAIPEVLLSPDAIAHGAKNSRGQDLIASVKRMPDGTLMVVEEVRTGKKTLSLASARRYPAAKDSDSVARTLLSNAHSDGGNPEIIVSHPPEDVKALYQGGDDPRASLSFSPDHPGFNMKFFEKADLSSFLHETSHMFLERMARDVEHPDAPQQLKDDFQAILTKLGAKDYASLTTEQHEAFAKMGEAYFGEGKAPSPELQGAFTRFSLWLSEVYRKMKTYFSDVKLSDDVRGVFDRLLATDEEIAAARKQQGYQPLFATAEDMGVSKAEFDAYAKMGAKDMQKAHDKLLGDMLKEKTRETTKWWKEALDKKKEEVTAEAQQEPVYQAFEALTKGKEFNGEEFPVKMDRQALVDMYGEEFVKGMPRGFGRMYAREGGVSPDDVAQHFGFSSGDEMLKRMMEAPRMKDYVRDEAARRMDQEHGNLLTDGSLPEKALEAVHNDEHGNLLRAELKVLKRKASEAGPAVDAAKKAGKIDADQAKREADYNARWKEAESKLSLAIERGAKQAEINDLKAQASAAKKAAQQGRKYVKDSIPPAEYFKSIAAAIMAGKRERDIMPQIYARAESKASREAFEAAGKQDWGAASEAKFKELLNHYLYKEAADTRDEVDKMYRYLVKAGKLETLQRVGKASQDMLSQVRGILDRYELVKVSNIELQNRESLAEYLQRFSDEHDGREIPVDERLLDPTYRANYRDVPVDELRGVYDSVKSIMHVVQAVNRVRSDQRAEQLHDVQEQMAARIHASKQNSAPDHLDRTSMTGWEKAGKTIGGLFSGLERMELNVFGRIDGGPDGPMHDFIWNPLLDGQAKFNDLLQQVLFGTVEMLDRMPKEQAKAIHDPAGIYIKSLDRSFSRSQLIGLAMHFGSDSNFDKVTRGGYYDANNERGKPLSADAVAEITRTLTKADWDLVQHVWDQMAKLKPHMAELEKRWNGLEPEWVELRKVVTPYGTYDGGYFPMVYASEASRAGEQQVNSQEEFNLKQYADSFSQASTKRGHLIARTEAAYQVSTDWQNITTRHLNDVITDIAYREPIYQANRILSGLQEVIGDAGEVTKIAPVKAALVKMYGKEMPLRLQKWLQSIVSYNSTNAGPGASDWERAVAFTRSRATAMHISYKITNAFAESVNAVFLQAWQQLDIKNIVHGALAATVNSPGESWQFALDNSQYYQHIEQNVNQNFVEAMNRLTGKHDVMSTVFKFGMELKAYFYKMQAVATFTGAYKQGMEQMYQDLPPAEAHQRAARFADSVIRTTNEAGSAMDLSPAESNPIMRNFTQWMGPVIVNLNQYINAVNTAGNEMDVAKATGKAAVTGLAQATPLMMRVFIGNYLANAILFPLLQGKAPAIGEDADKWRAWLLAKISTEWSAGIPIVREVGKGLESHITGEPYHLSSIPMLDMAKDMKDLPITALKYEQGNATGEQLSRAATNAGGWALGLPSSQMNITGKFIYDVLTGNYTPEHPWSPLQDILYRRKKH